MRLSEILHREHQRTLQVLNALDGWQGKPQPDQLAPIENLLKDVIDVTKSDVQDHYAFEEQHLFPVLRNNGADFMVNMLSGEHELIRPIAQALQSLSETALETGFTQESWAEFQTLSADFIGHETFHIQKEEMGLINAINAMFTPEEETPLIALYQKT
ncbi:hemerythrin domain-containing protein [Terasakiella sp. SH-1]|uniref:hemerythrin domain-containing protein n=1 Tax=Terasakiella sp. SH-1 TaxID=2560057 RepID=UPI0014318063|nr:hemerythrin domain-containing protein [Terasakiella sp. SH-1]